MARLTAEQIKYLTDKGISLADVFDASSYLKSSDWKFAMRAQGKNYAFGVEPCRKAQHSLKSRSGHCIQCNPQSISQRRQYRAPGLVYVAGSKRMGWIKIGMVEGGTGELGKRVKELNIVRYGGAGDWEVVATVKSPMAGEFESKIHGRLKEHSVTAYYDRADGRHKCREIFSCKLSDAERALRDILSPDLTIVFNDDKRIRKT